jgi:hypothetical protein
LQVSLTGNLSARDRFTLTNLVQYNLPIDIADGVEASCLSLS